MEEYADQDLELLAHDAFSVFGTDPDRWPDSVEFNRSGLSDVNIRGVWVLEKRTAFFNIPFREAVREPSDDITYSPESRGSSE